MIVPWSAGSVASKQRRNTFSFTATEIGIEDIRSTLRFVDSDGMAMYSGPRPVSNLPQTFLFPALKGKDDLGRHGVNVCRLTARSVAWLVLTHKTEMHGELGFGIAWCCQPHRKWHGHHLNLKMDMDGWSNLLCIPHVISLFFSHGYNLGLEK